MIFTTRHRAAAAAISVIACLSCSLPRAALATEGVAGRYIPGVFAGPGAGIVPPVPGTYWVNSNFVYQGSAGGAVQIPIGGQLQVGLDALFVGTTFTGLYVPKLKLGNATMAFGLSLPVQYVEGTAQVGLLGRTDTVFNIGDIAITPLLLGWHSGAHFVSAGLTIYAPTGEWQQGSLAFTGLNYWSFSPALAYTYLDPKQGLDFSVKAGIDINTENEDSNYLSGTMGHLDVTLTKSLSERFGIGIFGSVLYQLADDEGTLADQLNGFKGRSYAIGPLMTYKLKSEHHEINFALSWAPEFGVKNRLEGDAVYLNMSGKF